MIHHLLTTCFAIALLACNSLDAGVYGTLEFGDSRDTVTRKLDKSELVTSSLNKTFFGRTGINGIFKCKNKLAGLNYHLYFGWTNTGKLKEITLRSEEISKSQYQTTLLESWKKANALLTQAYQAPAQDGKYPTQADFQGRDILISHIWHKGSDQSILMGPGIIKNKCFLAIRFVDHRIEPIRTP
ncbi:MAG: hypothetical protein KJO21_09705 [Verrucomicrobiae bacterium]|nr:hypothetical protein [Verrucomicrobiae bacterium]NNJ43734.1 hypothetical protein [Akkermansiaceae bacterium]